MQAGSDANMVAHEDKHLSGAELFSALLLKFGKEGFDASVGNILGISACGR